MRSSRGKWQDCSAGDHTGSLRCLAIRMHVKMTLVVACMHGYLHLTALHEMLHACMCVSVAAQAVCIGQLRPEATHRDENLGKGSWRCFCICRVIDFITPLRRSTQCRSCMQDSMVRTQANEGIHKLGSDTPRNASKRTCCIIRQRGVAPISLAMSGSRSTVVVGH